MSALDFTARGLALQAHAQLAARPIIIGTFDEARASLPLVPSDSASVRTTGHAVPGIGAGIYSEFDPFTGVAIDASHVGSNFFTAFTAVDENGNARHFALSEASPDATQYGVLANVSTSNAARIHWLILDTAGKATAHLPLAPTACQTTLPLHGQDDMNLRLDGVLENVTSSASEPMSQPIYLGTFHNSFVSPGWTAGTPMTLHPGDFAADGAFELDNDPENDSWFSGLSAGDYVLFVSDAGYEFAIGGGTGGTGINRECTELYRIAEKHVGTPNRLVFDRPAPLGYSAGSLCDANNPDLVDHEGAGASFRVLANVRMTGAGGLKSRNLNFYRCGVRDLHIDIASAEGRMGFGGNLILDGLVRIGRVTALHKAWDIAARSARSHYEFGELTCLGDGTDKAAPGSFGENSRWCHVRGRTLRFPENFDDSAIAFNAARDCSAEIDLLHAPRIVGNPVVRFGTSTPVNLVNGGTYACQRNRVLVRNCRAQNPSTFVTILGDGTQTQDNVIDGGSSFFGKPTTAAVKDGGVRSRIGGYYENGDVDISEATDAQVDVRLGNGIVFGHTESSGRSIIVNGRRQWPGAFYAPVDTATGTVTYTPDASIGQVGENAFEHRIAFSAATGLVIASPVSAREGQVLTIEIRNATGAALTPQFDPVFLGVSPAATTNLRKAAYTFRYSGGKWLATSAIEDADYPGAIIFEADFSKQGRWQLEPGLAVEFGALTQTGATGTLRNAEINLSRLADGASYEVSVTIASRNTGLVRINLGNTPGTGILSNGTLTEVIAAGPTLDLKAIFSATANTAIAISAISVREL